MSPGAHTVSVVVPVYRGERTLDGLIAELIPFTHVRESPRGRDFRITEILLVDDGATDGSDQVIRRLAAQHAVVRPIWLSRNFGQHAATIAGMSSTGSDWIVTMDEDGQFDPADIGSMLDVAITEKAQLVYGSPTNTPPHGLARNLGSNAAKFFATRVLADKSLVRFSSFRLMVGELGRGVAAYVGPGVYLDVALGWAFGRVAHCPVEFRNSTDRTSGYSLRKLFSHFWQLVITVGPRPLRIVSLVGVLAALAGVVVAVVVLIERLLGHIDVAGWSSLAIIVLLIGGINLLALGVVAEYVGAAVRMAMGKPLYLIMSDELDGPIHRQRDDGGESQSSEAR